MAWREYSLSAGFVNAFVYRPASLRRAHRPGGAISWKSPIVASGTPAR